MYSLLRSLLFTLPPELAHEFSMVSLKYAVRGPVASFLAGRVTSQPVSLMGLAFPNPVGLAAGLDKNADYLDALAGLGFGFIEVGTVTPRPQAGNPKPRLFRIPEARAIINRMGFNNKGIDYLIRRVEAAHFRGILGINIGKNRDTPAEDAVNDYLHCLEKAYARASYIAVNISSPNTPGLRNLQSGDELEKLLSRLLERREQLAGGGRYVPLVLKIAPDLEAAALDEMATTLLKHRVDGVIVGNTTLSRDGVEHYANAKESGGLSGEPLRERSTRVLRELQARLNNAIPLIGVGGICSGKDALEKFDAGAKLVQIYTGFIYRGPELIREIAEIQGKGERGKGKGNV